MQGNCCKKDLWVGECFFICTASLDGSKLQNGKQLPASFQQATFMQRVPLLMFPIPMQSCQIDKDIWQWSHHLNFFPLEPTFLVEGLIALSTVENDLVARNISCNLYQVFNDPAKRPAWVLKVNYSMSDQQSAASWWLESQVWMLWATVSSSVADKMKRYLLPSFSPWYFGSTTASSMWPHCKTWSMKELPLVFRSSRQKHW